MEIEQTKIILLDIEGSILGFEFNFYYALPEDTFRIVTDLGEVVKSGFSSRVEAEHYAKESNIEIDNPMK